MKRKYFSDNPEEDLTDKQRLYISAYLEVLDGKLAAEMAGYSEKSAKYSSQALQQNKTVRAAIERGLEEREWEWKDKAIKVAEHAYCLATVDIADLFDADGNLLPTAQMPRAARRAISSIEVEFETKIQSSRDEAGRIVETFYRVPRVAKIRLHDKRASADLFLKYAGRLKDRVELDATRGFEQVVLEAARLRRERNSLPSAAQTGKVDP